MTGLACSCIVDVPTEPKNDHVQKRQKYPAFIDDIGPGSICIETEARFEVGLPLICTLTPIGGAPFVGHAKVRHTYPSSRKGFHMTVASFEDMSSPDRESLLNLLLMIGQMRKDMT